MRKAIGLVHLPPKGKMLGLLGVELDYEITGATPDSELVILCGCPKADSPWDFGSCFPQLPGAWAQGNANDAFHLRFLSMEGSIWIYVWSRSPDVKAVQAALKTNSVFDKWAKTKNDFDLDLHGLADTDLEEVPTHQRRVKIAQVGSTLSKPSFAGFFMWGDLGDSKVGLSSGSSSTQVVSAVALNTVLKGLHDFMDFTGKHLIFRAKLRFDQPDKSLIDEDPNSYLFRYLLLETPPITEELSGTFTLTGAAVVLSEPLYFSTEGARIGLTADLEFDEKSIHLELDYPITGDVIRAKGSYQGDPTHLLGDHANMGLPGGPKHAGSDTELTLALKFSKSDKTLDSVDFDFELNNKDWTLIPAPIDLALEGVIVQVTIIDPFPKKGEGERTILARLAMAAKFGAGDTPVRLLGGGKYPEGDIYLQSANSLKIGKLLEKLVGPTPALEKFSLENLRIDHNVRTKKTGLSFTVPERWHIAGSVELGELEFRVQGGQGQYQGGASAQLHLEMGDSGPLDIQLSALWNDGWEFEGETGPGQEIPVGHLFTGLATALGSKEAAPACLDALTVSNLSLYCNTKTRDFKFGALIEMNFDEETDAKEGAKVKAVEKNEDKNSKVTLDLQVSISHHTDPNDATNTVSETQLSGVIHFVVNDRAFELDVAFGKSEITLPTKENVTFSTFLASLKTTAGAPPSMKDFAPEKYKDMVPNVTTKSVFIAHQSREGDATKAKPKWLFGLSLEAGLDLSKAKLPSLPLAGNGGPPKSLIMNLQILLPVKGNKIFDVTEIAQIAKLNTDGGVSIPNHEIPGLVVSTTIDLDGKSLRLNLPIKPNPAASRDNGTQESAFSKGNNGHDPSAPVKPVPNMAQSTDTMKWINIQKSFGPIHIGRIGLKYEDEKLFVAFDAGLTAAGFTISLHGLGLDTPLTKFDPDFYITGLGLEYDSGGVTIGAAFLKEEMKDPDDPEKTYTAYSGEAVLKTASISLAALGSFAKLRGESSLFVYATLDSALGGPAFFFVTGLAAGFGYHRRAILPAIDQVHAYPLISKAIAGPVKRNAAGQVVKPDLATELGQLEAFLPPDPGSMFFAVGVKFSSFELIDSFALLVGQFGDHTAFDVLGVSQMHIPATPAGGEPTPPLAEIYMNWHGYLHPDEGSLGLEAQLAAGSYVFNQDCHLTGGFAYASWFSGDYEGDFVLTLGGYHRDYKKPGHYPVVPRLGLNWSLPAANLSIKGELYFALTADAFMVGGALNGSIHGGFDIGIAGVKYHADLCITADFLITWEPYHYDGTASIDLDIGLTAHLLMFSKSFSLNIGGDIHIWGPKFAGEAHLHVKVWKISHTIDVHFGAGPAKLLPITWDRFSASLLPKVSAKVSTKHSVCSVTVPSGLVSQNEDRWIVNPREFCMETNSTVPITEVTIGERNVAQHGDFEDEGPNGQPNVTGAFSEEFGVAPMGLHPNQITSLHSLFVTHTGDRPMRVDSMFRCEPMVKSMPKAMWGKPKFTDNTTQRYLAKPDLTPDPDGGFVKNVLTGVRILPANILHPTSSMPIDRRELRYDTERVGDAFAWDIIPQVQYDTSRPALSVLNDTLVARAKTVAERAEGKQTPAQRRLQIARELGLDEKRIRVSPSLVSRLVDHPQIEAQ
jgi:hypothetical protein